MKKLANFLLFQLGWFATVMAAAEGHLWLGPLAVAVLVAVHLAWFSAPGERRRELGFILAVGVIGTLADTGLRQLGATTYPTSAGAWSSFSAPLWITGLWVLFAILPFHSLRWLVGRPWLAAVLGAVGGPLSYLGGTRFGVVAVGESAGLTYGALAVEYALVTPLLLSLVARSSTTTPNPDS